MAMPTFFASSIKKYLCQKSTPYSLSITQKKSPLSKGQRALLFQFKQIRKGAKGALVK